MKIPTTKASQNIALVNNEVTEETEGYRDMLRNKEIPSENTIFIEQLRELVKYFSSIEHNNIRQYSIHIIRELSKCESNEKARMYVEDFTLTR